MLRVATLAIYAKVNYFLLTEYKIALVMLCTVLRRRTLSADRLRNLLTYYLSSRDIADLDGLCNFLVSEKLKEFLPQGPLSYAMSLEGEGWFDPDKIASLFDVFVINRGPAKG